MLNYEKLFSLKRIIKVFSRNFPESFSFHLAFCEKFIQARIGEEPGASFSIWGEEHFSGNVQHFLG